MIRHGDFQATGTPSLSTKSRKRSKPPPLPVSRSSDSAAPQTEVDTAGPPESANQRGPQPPPPAVRRWRARPAALRPPEHDP